MGKNKNTTGVRGAGGKCPDCGEILVATWCKFCGWPTSEKQVNPREEEFREIAFDVWQGTASFRDARQLLEAFCAPVESRDPSLDRLLTEHLRFALRMYLSGECKLETALGLKRRSAGQPRADAAIRQQAAAALLRHQLGLCRSWCCPQPAPMSYQEALKVTVRLIGHAKSVISEAWGEYKLSALSELLLERAFSNDAALSAHEVARLKKIYRGIPEALALLGGRP
jgi:hypothetical protein